MRNLAGVLPDVEIAAIEPLIAEIEALKTQRNAVVLAHNYMTPDIFHGVADLRGDSLALARDGRGHRRRRDRHGGRALHGRDRQDPEPRKTVLIPDLRAGCSLAESITGADVRLLRAALPRRAGRHLREHFRRGQGGVRHLLHLRQRSRGGRVARRADA